MIIVSILIKSQVILVQIRVDLIILDASIKKEYPKASKNHMLWGALKLRHNHMMRTSYQKDFQSPTSKCYK